MQNLKGKRILVATHLDQSNHIANEQQMLGFVVHFASLSILYKMLGQNRFDKPN
jgi:hypothetical protein